jgi:hypothetical protein
MRLKTLFNLIRDLFWTRVSTIAQWYAIDTAWNTEDTLKPRKSSSAAQPRRPLSI